MDIASALITCMILMSILVGLSGSFFLKKYIAQMYKIKCHSNLRIQDIPESKTAGDSLKTKAVLSKLEKICPIKKGLR